MVRYITKTCIQYGGWEIYDRAVEHPICYAHVQDDIIRVCVAMNEQAVRDKRENEIDESLRTTK